MDKTGLHPAGFSREITMIDAGFTSAVDQYATQITIPVADNRHSRITCCACFVSLNSVQTSFASPFGRGV